MYLSQLDLDKQKLFLDLCINTAKVDNNFDDKEKSVIDAYCFEMGLKNNDYTTKFSLEEVLNQMKKTCSPREINIILVEILALIMSDGKYDDLEADLTKTLRNILEISDEKFDKALQSITNLLTAYDMLFDVIENI